MIRAALAGALAASLLLAAAPAIAAPASDSTGLIQLQQEDARLQALGWRLARANAPFCTRTNPAIGLLLQDMAGYAEPARMRAAAGITGDVAVQAVVPGSPAARAGLLANAEIISIDGRAMADLPPATRNTWQRLTGLHDAIDAALARDGAVRIAWRTAGGAAREAAIAGEPVCTSRFELLDRGGRAAADGRRVVIGRNFSGFGLAEDEMAAAVAHELAHNLLAHRAWLRQAGRTQSNIRLTEREADRLMPWLLANAGYDPQAAERFFRKWGPFRDGWLFRMPTHDGWDERAKLVAAELPKIAALNAAGQPANWRAHFQRVTAE